MLHIFLGPRTIAFVTIRGSNIAMEPGGGSLHGVDCYNHNLVHNRPSRGQNYPPHLSWDRKNNNLQSLLGNSAG